MKRTLLLLLQPVARLAEKFSKLERAWALAILRSAIQWPAPISIVLLGKPEIHGSGNIKLGENLFLYRDLYLETQGSALIEICDNAVISRGVHIVAHSSIRIGEGSMIGEYSSIRDANHVFRSTGSLREAGHSGRPVTIGREVWIGRGSTILAGVTIGDRAVIGANSVVTRDVPPGEVVGGAPARALHRQDAQGAFAA